LLNYRLTNKTIEIIIDSMSNINEKEEKDSAARIDINTPHDRVVEKFLQENETARSLFREYLPQEIAGLLDLDSLEYIKDKFVDENLAKYFSDLLYKVNFTDHLQGFIFLLLEHKSTEFRFSSFQVLKYMVQIWDKFLVNNKKARYLPVIIPVVLYHGGKKWKLANRFIALFKFPELLKEFIPDFQFQLLDISHSADEEIKGNTVLRILLMTLKYIFKPELKHKLQEILKLFHEIKDKYSARDYLVALVNYLVNSPGNLTDNEINESISEVFSQGGDIMATIAEKWIDQGVEKGIEKGKWDVVKNMLRKGISIDFIEEITGFTAEKIKQFKEKKQSQEENISI